MVIFHYVFVKTLKRKSPRQISVSGIGWAFNIVTSQLEDRGLRYFTNFPISFWKPPVDHLSLLDEGLLYFSIDDAKLDR